jgi:prepilin-type N-terminal cleavage/methylation domain-containing protein
MSRGFTLAEIIVVLAVLGITAAVVVPAFTRLAPDDDETRAAAQLDGLVARARSTALQRATAVEVTLIPQSGRYWVRLGDGTPLDSGDIVLGPSVTLNSPVPRPRVRFSRLGVVDADSLVVLGPTGARLLGFDRWTGDARVEPR